jgi:hypothetical protein
MKPVTTLAAAAFILLIRLAPGEVNAGPGGNHEETSMKIQTGYAPVNGLKLYYEIHEFLDAMMPKTP